MDTNSDNNSINSSTSSNFSSTTSDSNTTSTESRSRSNTQSTLSSQYSTSNSNTSSSSTSMMSSLNSTDLDIPDIDIHQYHNNINLNSGIPSNNSSSLDNTNLSNSDSTESESPKIDFNQYFNNIDQNFLIPNSELNNSNTNTSVLSNSDSTGSEAPKIDFSHYHNNTSQNSLITNRNLCDTNVKSNRGINDAIKFNTDQSSSRSIIHEFTDSNDNLHNSQHSHGDNEDYADNIRNTHSHLEPDHSLAQISTVQSPLATPDQNANTVSTTAQPSSIASTLIAQLQDTMAQTKTHIATHYKQRFIENKTRSTNTSQHSNSVVHHTTESTVAHSTQSTHHQEVNSVAVPPVQSPTQHIVTAVALKTAMQSQSIPEELQPDTQPIDISQVQGSKNIQPTKHHINSPTVKHAAITQSNGTASKKRSTSNKYVMLKPIKCSTKPKKMHKYRKPIGFMLDNIGLMLLNRTSPSTLQPTQPNYSSKILYPIKQHTRNKMI